MEREPNAKLSESEIARGYALACQTRVLSDLKVTVPLESRIGDKKIFERAEPTPAHGYLLAAADWEERLPEWELDPPTRKVHLVLAEPTLDDNTSDAERIKRGLAVEGGLRDVVVDYPVLQRLPNMIRQSDWDITVTVLDSGMSCAPCASSREIPPRGNPPLPSMWVLRPSPPSSSTSIRGR